MNLPESQEYSGGDSQWRMYFSKQIGSFAFKPLLIDRLLNATSDYLAVSGSPSQQKDSHTPMLTRETIPLNRTKQIEKTIYVSAIARKLQRSQQKSPIEIAQEIKEAIDLSPDFTIHAIDGWIQFHLSESALGIWLQRLNQWPTGCQISIDRPLENQQKLYSAKDLFPIEYAHARCCSLLRLGDREGLIALSEPTLPDPHGACRQIVSPQPIPWLNAQKQLRLVHVTERTLISQLIGTLDILSTDRGETLSTQVVKLGTSLSQDFLTFYNENRIWGEVRRKNLALAQARLGLIRATQIGLKLLLEEGFGVVAPTEM